MRSAHPVEHPNTGAQTKCHSPHRYSYSRESNSYHFAESSRVALGTWAMGGGMSGGELSTVAIALAYTVGRTRGPVLTVMGYLVLLGRSLPITTALAVATIIGVWAARSIVLPRVRLNSAAALEPGAAT
jgi:hypothetical protein